MSDSRTSGSVSGGGTGATYTQATPVPITVAGIAAGETFDNATMQFMWDDLLQQYVPPQITLSAIPGAGVREIGTSLSSVALSATTVAHTNPITSVEFFRNGVSIHVVASPSPTGGVETFTDTTPVTSNTSYTAVVSDGTTPVTSNAIVDSFLSSVYRGVSHTAITTGAGIMAAFSGSATLANTRVSSALYDCSVDGGANRIHYAYPVSFGYPTGVAEPGGGSPFAPPNPGIPFGVSPALVPLTDYSVYRSSLTNVSGYTQDYYIIIPTLTYSANNLTLGVT